ncbi:MAG: hypothetical protein M1538_01275 [Candidatus Marsarchaeota archaeon]|jgi:hypothetical protein|nr:hypothetical protein [Candidatus Marsarchaeota archaeon]
MPEEQSSKTEDKSVWLYLIASIGVITALLFSMATTIDLLIKEVNSILVIDGILIPFIPIFFRYLQKSFEYFKGKVEKIVIRLEMFLAVSLICSIFANGFSNVFSLSLPFSILKLNFIQYLYIINLSAALSFLFAALISIIYISFKAINYVDLSFLNNVKISLLNYFIYLPIYAKEDMQKPDAIADILKSPIHYFDKTAIQSNINSILNYDKTMPKDKKDKIDVVINCFLDKFPNLAENVLNKYFVVYNKLYKSSKTVLGSVAEEDQITLLVRALINVILGYDKHYFPNIYTRIVNTENLNRAYVSIQEAFLSYNEVQDYKVSVEQIQELKSYISKQFDDIISTQI